MNFFAEAAVLLVIIASVVFGIFLLFYRKKRISEGVMKKIQLLWREVENLAQAHPEQAIMKADKLLDFALHKAGYQGNLGEKLKKSKALFHDINAIWSAHKLRNRIAHEVDIHISNQQAINALKGFKRAFSDLGISL